MNSITRHRQNHRTEHSTSCRQAVPGHTAGSRVISWKITEEKRMNRYCSEREQSVGLLHDLVKVAHRRNRAYIGTSGMADIQACAAGENPAAAVGKRPQLLRHVEPGRIDRFALDAFANQKPPDGVPLVERKNPKPERVPDRFGVVRVNYYSQLHVISLRFRCSNADKAPPDADRK